MLNLLSMMLTALLPMEIMKNEEFNDQIGFRVRASDKEALKHLAQRGGFKDSAALLRAVIQDLLKGQKTQLPNIAPDQEKILSRLGNLEAAFNQIRETDLRQIKIALFIVGTEQRKQGASLTLVNPLQAKRMQNIFPEFINQKESP